MDPSNPEPSTSTKTKRTRRKTKQRNDLNSSEYLKLKVKWSDEEGAIVLKGLDELGLTRINTIAEQLPHKTPEQLKAWLWKMGRTNHRLKQMDRAVHTVISKDECSVGVGLGNMERGKKTGINSRQLSAISKSLLLISTLEEQPPASGPQDIDFKKLYTALYMAIKGYPLPRMNMATHVFFVQSVEMLLKAAKCNPIDASPCGNSMPLERLAESVVLNPLSVEVDSLQAKIIPKKTYQALQKVKINKWLSPYDWSQL